MTFSIGNHIAKAYNEGCLDHIALAVWLNGLLVALTTSKVAKVAAGVRFELTDGVLAPSLASKTSGLNHSPSPPLTKSSSFLLTSRLDAPHFLDLRVRRVRNNNILLIWRAPLPGKEINHRLI